MTLGIEFPSIVIEVTIDAMKSSLIIGQDIASIQISILEGFRCVVRVCVYAVPSVLGGEGAYHA